MNGRRWTRNKAAWYGRAAECSDYSERVLDALTEVLDRCRSVADIGAGTGALAIPLCERGIRVTAVEPSGAMRAVLKRGARNAGCGDRLTLVDTAWKDAELARHDLLLFASVPEQLLAGEDFVARTRRSARYVALVRTAGPWDKFWYRDLYPLVLGRPWEDRGDYLETLVRLHRQGVYGNVKIFSYTLDQPFDSFEEAMAFWVERLKPHSDREPLLREYLSRRLTKTETGWLAEFGVRRGAAIWWKTSNIGKRLRRP